MVRPLSVVALLGCCFTPPLRAQAYRTSPPPRLPAQLARIRDALHRYQDPISAVHDGYLSTVACVEYAVAGRAGQMSYPAGGMGVHFMNMGLIGAQLDSLRPTVLIYEPDHDSLRLVAAEWFVPTSVTRDRPRLFGHAFDGPMEGHHPVMPSALHHWDLHVWLWKANPSGPFSPTNPNVHCPKQAYSYKDQPPKAVQP